MLKRLTCAEEAAAEADQQTEEEEEQDVDVLGGGGRVLVDPGQRSCRSTPECERCASGTTLCLALALSLSRSHPRTRTSPRDKLLLASTASSLENAQIKFD